MIKTINKVSVNRKDDRGTVMRTVYSIVSKIEILKTSYYIHIQEFVVEDLDSHKEVEINHPKARVREIYTSIFEKSTQEILDLIKIFEDAEQLTAFGLTDLIGYYDKLNQIERNDYVADVGHLIENNQSLIRGVNWTFVEQINKEE